MRETLNEQNEVTIILAKRLLFETLNQIPSLGSNNSRLVII